MLEPSLRESGNDDPELDEALDMTFPASDPVAVFRPDRTHQTVVVPQNLDAANLRAKGEGK